MKNTIIKQMFMNGCQLTLIGALLWTRVHAD